jgi:hypothetical protein
MKGHYLILRWDGSKMLPTADFTMLKILVEIIVLIMAGVVSAMSQEQSSGHSSEVSQPAFTG